jgi:transcriptional regulator GlxA family with amidase domain
VHRVQNAVSEKPALAWSLQNMAALAHVTPRHLSRLFETHVGCTPHHYVQTVRIALAQRALAQGQTPKRALTEAGIAGARQWRRLRTQAAHKNAAENSANNSRGKSPDG